MKHAYLGREYPSSDIDAAIEKRKDEIVAYQAKDIATEAAQQVKLEERRVMNLLRGVSLGNRTSAYFGRRNSTGYHFA